MLLDEPIYLVRDAAKETGLSTWTIWDGLKTGRLMRTKVGGRTYVRRSELLKLVVETTNEPKPKPEPIVVETRGPRKTKAK